MGTVWKANITDRFVPDSLVFNSSATFVLDNLIHPCTIELTKFGTECDNIIVPMKRLNSLDCNPELSTFHHSSSSSLGVALFTETLWIGGKSGRRILHVERKQLLLIFGIISGCCWDCAQVRQRTNHWIKPSMGIKLTTVQTEHSACLCVCLCGAVTASKQAGTLDSYGCTAPAIYLTESRLRSRLESKLYNQSTTSEKGQCISVHSLSSPCDLVLNPAFSLVAFLGIGVKRCRVILTARGHPRSPIHTHTITQTCTHTYAQAFSHTLYMLEKNILTFALQNSTRASV